MFAALAVLLAFSPLVLILRRAAPARRGLGYGHWYLGTMIGFIHVGQQAIDCLQALRKEPGFKMLEARECPWALCLPGIWLTLALQVVHLFANASEAPQQGTEVAQKNHPGEDVGGFQRNWASHRAPTCKAAVTCAASTFSSNICRR